MVSNVARVTLSLVGLVAVFHLMTPMAAMIYWNQWPKMSQMSLIALIAPMVVMEVIILMAFCFDSYNFSSSFSSCVLSNNPHCNNSCKGFNGQDGCNGPNGYISHHGCTDH